jgi:predicted nucleic acid-binding protein
MHCGEFLPYAETVVLPANPPQGPRCRDPHEQAFIDLATVADAEGIVTGDEGSARALRSNAYIDSAAGPLAPYTLR